MKKYLMILAFILMLSVCCGACAAAVKPIAVQPDSVDVTSGTFPVKIQDADKILNGGWFTLAIYEKDTYEGKEIEALRAGDTVEVNGQTVIVSETIWHEEGIEIYFEGPDYSYIVFLKDPDTGRYTVLVDDWNAMSYVKSVKVMMPLYDRFVFRESFEDEHSDCDQNAFVKMLPDLEEAYYSQYNTTVTMEDGMPSMIEHFSYPFGPMDYE